jgi:hypothetical protein
MGQIQGGCTMKYICGVAAIVILIAGVIMIWQSTKSGKVFDCIEDSKTEQQWVHRAQDPRKFRSIITFYVVGFTAVILILGWMAIGGQPTS